MITHDVVSLIPVDCFLNRVFPVSFYEDKYNYIVDNRVFKPRNDCEDYLILLPIDWEAIDKIEDRNWRMQLQGWAMFFPIMNFFDVYHDKEKLVEYFFDVASDWYAKYGDDPDDIVTTRMPKSYAWYDMSAGFRALVIAFFKNRILVNQISLTHPNEVLLEKLTIKHIRHLSNEKVFSLNNHGMFQIQGLMSLIQQEDIVEFEKEYNYALNRMEELIRSQYDSKGVHQEHSPHYHFYALTTFEKILKNEWYEKKPIIKELVVKASAVKKWIVDPLARPACIGDSILTVQKSVDFSNTDFSGELEKDIPKGVLSNFHESGYQIFRSKWETRPEESSYVFFMGMYHSKSHKHRDCLTFEWFDNGKKIICDSGKYGYKSNKYRNYFLSSRAHNSVEIEGFDILKIQPYGSCLQEAEEKDGLVVMKGSLDYPAVYHKRELIINPSKWIIVKDELKFQRVREFTQWFHPDKTFHIKSSVENRVVLSNEEDSLIVNCLNKNLSVTLHQGDESSMQGFVSEKDFQYESSVAIGYSGAVDENIVVTILALTEEYEKNAIDYLVGSKKTEPKILKNLLGKCVHVNRTKYQRYDLLEGKYTYQYFLDQLNLIFYANIKQNSEKLTIMLPGAVNRKKTIYNFQRYSWSQDIDGSVISFLDPTVAENNDITIGWFQGNEKKYAIPVLVKLIKDLLIVNNIKESNLTIFGSSAGGFSSLKIADEFPNSRVMVINPQTRIFNYSYKEYQKIVNWVFPDLTPEKAKDIHKDRLKIELNTENRKSPILYYQNVDDGHHLQHHLKPLLESLNEQEYEIVDGLNKTFSTDKNLKVIYYSDPKSGHSPLTKEDTVSILNREY